MNSQDTKTIFENEVKKAFGGLKAKGYRYVGISEKRDNLLGVYLRIEFENREIGRKIALHYIPKTNDRSDGLSLYLENGPRDCFSASEYLKAQGEKPDAIGKLQIKNYTGSLEMRMRACLVELWKFLDQVVPAVVDGVEWKHIPVDWGGYR
jgi:hypothetical protein